MQDYEEVAPNLKKALVERAKKKIPFWVLLGMEVADVKKGWAQIRIPFSDKLTNANGMVHGGAIFSAADSATGMALLGMLDKGIRIATLELKINYLRPVSQGGIIAESRIIHKGMQTAIGDTDVRNDAGELVAKALCTYAIIGKT